MHPQGPFARQKRGERAHRLARVQAVAEQILRQGNARPLARGTGERQVLPEAERDGTVGQSVYKHMNVVRGCQRALLLPGDRHGRRGRGGRPAGRERQQAGDQGFHLIFFQHGRAAGQVAHAARLPVQLDGRIAVDRGELLAHQRALASVDHALAQLALQVRRCGIQRALDGAVLRKQLHRRLLAHARHAGDVVRRVAHQPLEVGNLRGRDAERRQHRLRIELHRVGDAALGVQHVRLFAHQLHGVTVARHQQRTHAARLAQTADRAEHVVRLERGQLQLHDAHGVRAALRAWACAPPCIRQSPHGETSARACQRRRPGRMGAPVPEA